MTSTTATGTRAKVGHAFRRPPGARRRERYHGRLLRMEGQSCPEVAPWRSPDVETMRRWVRALKEAGLQGRERSALPGRSA